MLRHPAPTSCSDSAGPAQARFRKISDSEQADWQPIIAGHRQLAAGLPDRILSHLEFLGGDHGGFPVDRLQHSLQAAELAAEAGEDDEYIVCALLHDIGDTLGTYNHPDVAAVLLEPFVSEENRWMVQHHGIFQGHNFFHHLGMDRNLRDRFRGSPHYERTERFVALYDDAAFDYEKPHLSLDLFRGIVRTVLAQPINTLYAAVTQAVEDEARV